MSTTTLTALLPLLQAKSDRKLPGQGADPLQGGPQGAGRACRRESRQAADPSAADRQGVSDQACGRRDLYLRCRAADGLGGALSGDEWQTPVARFVQWHGSMANAMAQAIGAQAAFPGRQVISLSGDGGFSMLMGDFLSLAQLGLPVKVVVFNNGTLGFVEFESKGGWLSRLRSPARQSELRRDGRSGRHQGHPHRGSGRCRARHWRGAEPQTGPWWSTPLSIGRS